MSSFRILFFAATLLPFHVCALASARPKADWENLKPRELRAVPAKSVLKARDGRFGLSNVATLRYESDAKEDPAIHITIHSDTPFLNLESNDQHFRSVVCGDSSLELRFNARDTFDAAQSDLLQLVDNHVVTTHSGCNEDGARGVYRVANVMFNDEDDYVLLSTVPVDLRETFPVHSVEFDHERSASPSPALQKRVERRNTNLLPDDVLEAGPAHRGTANVSQLETTESHVAVTNISRGFIDKDLPLPFGLDELVPISLKCKNCSMYGTTVVKRGAFNFDTPTIDNPIAYTGSMTVHLNDFFVIVELENEFDKAFSHEFDLFTLPIIGFKVPAFATIGVFLDVPLNVEIAVNGGLSLTYGFTFALPPTTTVFVDYTDLNNSFTSGFDKPKFEAIPFSVNVTDVELKTTITLQPVIAVGFDFEPSAPVLNKFGAKAEAGIFFNLPSLTIDTSILDKPDVCELGSTLSNKSMYGMDSAAVEKQNAGFLESLGKVTHVEPTVELAIGVVAGGEAEIFGKEHKKNFQRTLLSMTIPGLPTACLAFNTAEKKLEAATKVLASMTSAASASASSSASAASHKPWHSTGSDGHVNAEGGDSSAASGGSNQAGAAAEGVRPNLVLMMAVGVMSGMGFLAWL